LVWRTGIGGDLKLRPLTDRELIVRSKSGDLQAYNLLVARWEKTLFNFMLSRIEDKDVALHDTEAVFSKAYQDLTKLVEIKNFPVWLFRIAHDETVRLGESRTSNRGIGSPRTEDAPRARTADGSSAMRLALRDLPEDQRVLIQLKIFHRFTFDEIAEILGCTISAVKDRLYAALDLLETAAVVFPISTVSNRSSEPLDF
jgi:RNA polymerase sigma-70 factor (ECF subfamily)